MNSIAKPLLTTLIVSYNTKELLDECLGALRAAQAAIGGGEVIVVDNASRDGSAEHLAEHAPEVTLIRSAQNVGFGRANNLALPAVRTPYLLLLNTDAFVPPQSLRLTLDYMAANPDCGILGVRLVGRDGALQPSCRYFPTAWNLFLTRTGLSKWLPGRLVDDMDWDHRTVRDCDWVPGCFYLVRSEVVGQVGLFDPRFFMYYEEVDHCLAAKRAGWRVAFYPHTEVVHIGGESARKDSAISTSGRQVEILQIESGLLYFRKNAGLAGLLRHVALETAADALLAFKSALRGRGAAARYHLRRIGALFGLAGRTGLGRRPTR
ncbi:MAG: glycosyltransferase family 2 protein [Burkholderiaceae bacterium]